MADHPHPLSDTPRQTFDRLSAKARAYQPLTPDERVTLAHAADTIITALTEKHEREMANRQRLLDECSGEAHRLRAIANDRAYNLAAIRAEVEKLGHEDGCALYGYSGEDCVECGVGKVHTGNSRCSFGKPHHWRITPKKDCNCARGRAMKLAGGEK